MSSSSASSSLILVSDDEVNELVAGLVFVLALVVVVVVFVLALVVVVMLVLGPLVVVVYLFRLRYMGAAESKPEEEGTNNKQDRDDWEGSTGSNQNGSSSLEISTGTALAVGATLLWVAWGESSSWGGSTALAVGTTLLGVAWIIIFMPIKTMPGRLKILSYNVWSREDYATHERMKAIGDLVQLHSPHFLCFQEITPAIYNIFQGSSWWNDYYCSTSTEEASNKKYFCILLSKFRPVNTTLTPIGMGKELCVTETKITGTNKSLVVATSHLKNPTHNNLFIEQRSDQAKEAISILKNYPNVIFGGDMNWDEETDGEFPLLEGWVDAWTELRGEEVGYTYDTKSNKMLKGHQPTLQKRFDRIMCNLNGFKLEKIEIVGKEAIPDQWTNMKLPLMPSDHYGLLLTVCT